MPATMTQPLYSRLLQSALSICALLALGACGGGGGATQLAVKVNDGEVSVHQLEISARGPLLNAPPERAVEVTRQVLDGLVDQELAAQAARTDGLDSDPKVVQQLELAKREVLARAWQDKLTQAVTDPASDQVDQFYAANSALFAERRIYSLQEHNVELPHDKVQALKQRLEAATTAAQATEAVRADGQKVITQNFNAQAEEIPLLVLRKLAMLKPGQTLVIPREGGLKAMTIVDAVAMPIERNTARRRIVSYLANERRMEVIAASMKQMRAQARIEYVGPYAKAASAAAAR